MDHYLKVVEELAIDSGYYGAKTEKTWWEPYRILVES